MWDRQTQTWWQQLTGEAIIGELAGHKLPLIPASIISWADFKEANPNSLVLCRDTGFSRSYGSNLYVGNDRVDRTPFLFDGDQDDRRLPKERVAAIDIGDVSAAFPFPRWKPNAKSTTRSTGPAQWSSLSWELFQP